jgi:hypothetical protein
MKTTLIMADISGLLMGAGAIYTIFAIVIGMLYALFPLIVMWQLGGIKKRLDQASDDEGKEHDELLEELKKQNKLTRQLLKAYGHEPEV